MYGTVLERHSVTKSLERRRVDDSLDLRQIGLLDLVRRVGQPVRELAVVGEDDEALGVRVEPPHVEESFLTLLDEVGESGPTFWIGHRQQAPRRDIDDVRSRR